ncbi:MAG: DNA translocase FtsK [Termitinemataceae bacterium]|nr:MAG: DNA translocase FtsK [Termitinemataceae bacterium]
MDSVYNFASARLNRNDNSRNTRINDKRNTKPQGRSENLTKTKFDSKKVSFYSSIFLFFLAIVIALSLSASLFHFPDIHSLLGDFFADSYSVLAFIIPIYLICAALVLLDCEYRPDRIFILNSSIFPFFTMVMGLSYVRDFSYYQDKFVLLSVLGKNGFVFFMIFLTVVESLVIASLNSILFPAPVKLRERRQTTQMPSAASFNKDMSRKPSVSAQFVQSAHSERTSGNFYPNNSEIKIVRRSAERSTQNTETKENVEKAEQTKVEQITTENSKQDDIEESDEMEMLNDFKLDKLLGINPDLSMAGLQAFTEAYNEAFLNMESLLIEDHSCANTTRKGLERNFAEQNWSGKPDPAAGGDAPIKTTELDEVDTEFCKIDPALDALDIKLHGLDSGLDDLDSRFSKIDSDLKTLTEELCAVIDGSLQGTDGVSGLKPVEDAEVLGSIETDESVEKDAADELEEIILLSEKAAEINTEKVINNTKTEAVKKKPCVYSVPVESILKGYADADYGIIDETTRYAANILKETLNEFKIQAEVTGIRKGPVITMFEILPSPGVKLSKIVNLQDNIALRLAASSVRIVAPIPGKHAVGIEIPNKKRNIVSFREIIEGELLREGKKAQIPVVLGKDITGEAVTEDLASMPHLLIAGSTGSGKSVCVNTLILSILYQCRPQECRLILIDPKIVELKLYNGIPHLLTPVITEPKRAFQALQYCIFEMERRYACLDSLGVRDIKTYNKRIKERKIAAEHMPYIVVVIDEFADLMATTGKELESTVARLAAMSRAVGIHLVLATQRPSIDVITGLIKSNIPSRIAFMVASMMDSRIIIDGPGAEKLLGKGDMLYAGVTSPFPVRLQGAFVSEEEVEAVVEHVKTLGEPDYIDEEMFFDDDEEVVQNVYTEGCDPLYDQALEIVVQQGKASASYIQRRLKIGYNRAARLVEEMEERGVVGAAQGSRPRELLRAV